MIVCAQETRDSDHKLLERGRVNVCSVELAFQMIGVLTQDAHATVV
jgi:hypothetical protein